MVSLQGGGVGGGGVLLYHLVLELHLLLKTFEFLGLSPDLLKKKMI